MLARKIIKRSDVTLFKDLKTGIFYRGIKKNQDWKDGYVIWIQPKNDNFLIKDKMYCIYNNMLFKDKSDSWRMNTPNAPIEKFIECPNQKVEYQLFDSGIVSNPIRGNYTLEF